MHYFGGKCRIAKQIGKYINENIKPGQSYWEPFVGRAWVMAEINPDRIRIGSDLHMELISMWIALQNGWVPPDEVSEEEYHRVKNSKEQSDWPLKAFVGFGCSYAGKYWGGYARDPKSDRNYASNAKNSLLKSLPKLMDVKFFWEDFFTFFESGCMPAGHFFYCDIPYKNTTQYSLGKFDVDKFWQCVRILSETNDVVISEYVAPDDFECVLEIATKTDIGSKDKSKLPRIEKLFRMKK